MAGERYWRGKFYPTWQAMSTAVKAAGIDPNTWLRNHPAAAAKYGVSPTSGGGTTNTTSSSASGTAGQIVGSQIIPNAGIYKEAQNEAQLAYERALAGINEGRMATNAQFGMRADGTEDPSAEYGVLQQLRHSQAREADMAEEYAVAGGRQGGVLGGQMEDLRYEHGGQHRDAANAYSSAMRELSGAEQQARYDLSYANKQAEQDALMAAIAAGDFTPADVSDIMASYSEETTTTGNTSGPAVSNRPGYTRVADRPRNQRNGNRNGPSAPRVGNKPMKLVNGRWVVDQANWRRTQAYRKRLRLARQRRQGQGGGAA